MNEGVELVGGREGGDGGGGGALCNISCFQLADREVRGAELGLLRKAGEPRCDQPRKTGRIWNVSDP